MNIEPLESRIAPAAVSVVYTDIDSDKVTITDSSGTLTAANLTFLGGGSSGQLAKLDLSAVGFAAANITVTVAKAAHGDGLANIGFIDAGARNLGAVSIHGDLGRIKAGSDSETVPAIKSLTVNSIGRLNTDTQAAGGSLRSDIAGALGALTVRGDVVGAYLNVTGNDTDGANGHIGAINIGGSLIAGTGAFNSGEIASAGDIGAIRIVHDVRGGSGQNSAFIYCGGASIASVSIGGSLIGGSGVRSGEIESNGDIGPISIIHNVQGGGGDESGKIESYGAIGNVTIGGSFLGGAGKYDTITDMNSVLHFGQIFSVGDMGNVRIAHDVQGGAGADSGAIFSHGKMASMSIAGSLIGGEGAESGRIFSNLDMGPVRIAGSCIGTAGSFSGTVSTNAGRIASVTIGGSLIGGATQDGGSISSGPGGLGPVVITGDMRGGDGDRSATIMSFGLIDKITVGGSIIGASGTGYGQDAEIFSAVGIGSVEIDGSLVGGGRDNSGEILCFGPIGSVKIGHDLAAGNGKESGRIDSGGTLGAVSIGGSLLGGVGNEYTTTETMMIVHDGQIFAVGDIAGVTVGHNVQGADGDNSGSVHAGGKLIKGMTVGGSLIGGDGTQSGEIESDLDMGPVRIVHDLKGSTGGASGTVQTGGKLASISIGGSLIGGSNTETGEIQTLGDIGAITIGHDFVGGSVSGSQALRAAGYIESGGRIASVTIGGSIISGLDTSSGALTENASIRAQDDIGLLFVKGSIVGNSYGDPSPVIISARGQHPPGAPTDLAIGRIAVIGRVEFASFDAGYDLTITGVNGDAQIGAVTVGGDWIASNLLAGVKNTASGDVKFGDANDSSINAGNPGIVSRIASIAIGGQLFGTPASVNPNDHFGFVAEQIGGMTIGGNSIAIPTNNTPLNIGETTDFSIHIVP